MSHPRHFQCAAPGWAVTVVHRDAHAHLEWIVCPVVGWQNVSRSGAGRCPVFLWLASTAVTVSELPEFAIILDTAPDDIAVQRARREAPDDCVVRRPWGEVLRTGAVHEEHTTFAPAGSRSGN